MRQALRFPIALALTFLLCSPPVFAESYRGDMNSWGTTFMSQDSTFGNIWNVTFTNEAVDGSSNFKFDQDGDWDPQWGSGTDSQNASANASVGQVRCSCSGETVGNMTVGVSSGKVYTFRLNGTASWWDRQFVVMETDAWPVDPVSVSDNAATVNTGDVTVTVQLSGSKSAQENLYVRYSTDGGVNWGLASGSGSGTNYTATIPGQSAGTTVEYYALSSTFGTSLVGQNPDLTTLRGKTAGSTNYAYTTTAQGFDPGTVWHIPTNSEPAGTTMRSPVSPSATFDTFFYNGSYSVDSDQSGGWLMFRQAGAGSWSSNALGFDSQSGDDKYWYTNIPAATYSNGDDIEYFFETAFTDKDTTYIGTTNDGAGYVLYSNDTEAAANPFTFTFEALLGNSWHFPTNAEPSGAFMRNPPTNGVPPGTDVFFYNGTFTNDFNQTGGSLSYRQAGSGSAWTATNLSFDSNTGGGNQYWVTQIPGDTFGSTNEVEYYFTITYGNADTTYLGSTDSVGTVRYAAEADAQSNPYTYTYGQEAADLGNCWHNPTNAEPPGVTMRNPVNDPATNQDVYVYNGNQFQGAGTPGDQTGGTLYYRKVGDAAWQSDSLVFNAESGEVGNNKYWRGVIPGGTFDATNQVEYFLEVTYSDRDTTYLGTTDQLTSTRYATQGVAETNAFRTTYSEVLGRAAAFMWHADNRVANSTNVDFWVKIGYAEGIGSNKYVEEAAIYYTTNGLEPEGSHGIATNADTMVSRMAFSHMEEDSFEGGDAMWWRGSISNLPTSTLIRYRIGSWNTSNTLERFADYNTSGTNDAIFSFALGVTGSQSLTVNGVEADYTTTKFFLDEIAGDTEEVLVRYTPGVANVTNVEVFSNIDRRDYADIDYTNANISGDGYPDGIKPPDGNLITIADTGAYFRAWTMTDAGGGEYVWTGTVKRTGAYRLTARFQTNNSPDYVWYTGEGRRDHAIVATPTKALDMTLYELNTLTVEAEDTTKPGRSTFRDLLSTNDVAGDDDNYDPFNLEYLNLIQANCLWFQPIHPAGTNRVENDPATGSPYQPGSPYATRDYWAVTPDMGSDGSSEAVAMAEFTNFVAQCDAYTGSVGSIHIMLDGVFNHTSWDAEMGQGGVDLGFTADPDARIGSTRPQWYARVDDYGEPGTYYNSPSDNDFATAPDRGDFGKWSDVTELYFGKYSALVRNNPEDNSDYLNEDDIYDFAGMTTNQMDIWKYFGYYTPYWLEKTGHPGSNTWDEAQDDLGIDALRCDFGQGLPPQAWEYIINRTRSVKWNFVFMAETLDGGKPGYRSNRHFDILNESLVFQYTQAKIDSAATLVDQLESRRNSYSGGAILLNQTSHDEVLPSDDPWLTASRYAAVSSVEGLPMMFYGQEQGIENFDSGSTDDGFVHHELNFGKWIPHFKKWNRLLVWDNPPPFGNNMDQWYGRVNWARLNSPALRSPNRYFLNTTGGGRKDQIMAVAKYETPYAGPATSDVVLAFSRFLEHGQAHSMAADTFDLQGAWDLLGLETGKMYQVRNLASSDAFAAITNGWPKSGADLYNNGIFVQLDAGTGADAIYDDGELVQYLKLEEVNQAPVISLPGPHTLPVGASTNFGVSASDPDGDSVSLVFQQGPAGATFNAGTFAWTAGAADANSTNAVIFTADDGRGDANSIATNQTTIWVPYDSDGDALGDGWEYDNFATLTNAADGDVDGDGADNLHEFIAGTAATNSGSLFAITTVEEAAGFSDVTLTIPTVDGRKYTIEYTDLPLTNQVTWTAFGSTNAGVYHETAPGGGTHQFVDDFGPNTSGGQPAGGHRVYRIRVE